MTTCKTTETDKLDRLYDEGLIPYDALTSIIPSYSLKEKDILILNDNIYRVIDRFNPINNSILCRTDHYNKVTVHLRDVTHFMSYNEEKWNELVQQDIGRNIVLNSLMAVKGENTIFDSVPLKHRIIPFNDLCETEQEVAIQMIESSGSEGNPTFVFNPDYRKMRTMRIILDPITREAIGYVNMENKIKGSTTFNFIHHIWIKPEHRNKLIGTAVLLSIRNGNPFETYVPVFNEKASVFFKRLDFKTQPTNVNLRGHECKWLMFENN